MFGEIWHWCFWTVVLENTLESPLDSKEIKLVNSKGNQPWISFWRTGAEAEASIIWPPDAKSLLIGKDPDAGKDWGQDEKEATEHGWMTSSTQWTKVWANSGRWWRTGKPDMLQSMELQRAGHAWEAEQQQQRCREVDKTLRFHHVAEISLWKESGNLLVSNCVLWLGLHYIPFKFICWSPNP